MASAAGLAQFTNMPQFVFGQADGTGDGYIAVGGYAMLKGPRIMELVQTHYDGNVENNLKNDGDGLCPESARVYIHVKWPQPTKSVGR